jgi:hypothetical protein
MLLFSQNMQRQLDKYTLQGQMLSMFFRLFILWSYQAILL